MPKLTQGLFFEMTSPEDRERLKPKYTLKERDHTFKGTKYKSMHNIYMSMDDPTEYSFVMKTLGNWKHWKALCKLSWFKPFVESWREELEVKLRSDGIKAVIDDVNSENKSSASSAKWVAEKGWEKGTGKGRPSKATIDKEANKLLSLDKEVEEDLTRMEAMH